MLKNLFIFISCLAAIAAGVYLTGTLIHASKDIRDSVTELKSQINDLKRGVTHVQRQLEEAAEIRTEKARARATAKKVETPVSETPIPRTAPELAPDPY